MSIQGGGVGDGCGNDGAGRIAFVQGKCACGVYDFRLFAVLQIDFYDVEAHGNVAAEQGKPLACAVAQQKAFGEIDVAAGLAVPVGRGAFDFHENECVSVPAHEVDFTPAAPAEVLSQYPEAVGPQPGGCHVFAVATHVGPIRLLVRR